MESCISFQITISRKAFFTPDLKKAINILIETQSEVDFHSENPNVFEMNKGGFKNHIKGNDALRKLTSKVALKNPEQLTAIKLSKYVPTLSQTLT